MVGYTISFSISCFGDSPAREERRCAHECWTHHLCSTCRTASSTRFRSGRGALPRSAAGAIFLLHGSTAVHGLRAAHWTIEFARDRLLPAGGGVATLSLRHSFH